MTTARPRPIGTVMRAISRVFTIERSSSSSCSCAVKFSKPTHVSSVRPSHEAKARTRLADERQQHEHGHADDLRADEDVAPARSRRRQADSCGARPARMAR